MKHRRTRKLIKSGLQLRLVLVFLSLACVAAVFQLVMVASSLSGVADGMQEGGAELAHELPGIVLTNLLLTLGVLVPLMIFAGIVATHRIAGPVYRFEQHLGALARGEDPGECRLRKGDELQELCRVLNAAQARWTGADAAAAQDETERREAA